MAAYYRATSALVKRYAREQGSTWVGTLVDPAFGHDRSLVRLAGVELVAAVMRTSRTGGITAAEAVQATRLFRQDWLQDYLILEVTPAITDRAMDLAEAYGLRGYDAVQLGAALDIHVTRQVLSLLSLTFVSADTAQCHAARAEGLLVEDPNAYP